MAFFKSLGAHAKSLAIHERNIFLPSAVLRFGITEDFSKDMPADALVEKVSLDVLSGVKKIGDRFVIGRRWWDPKPDGWFKKPWGSMQMTISIGAAIDKQGEKINICDFSQADFMGFYRESLMEKWRAHNEAIAPGDVLQYGVDVPPLFSAKGQEFIPNFGYGKTRSGNIFLETATGHGAVIYYYYAFPVGAEFFLEFEFVGAPDLNGSPYVFQAQIRERINSIKDSVTLSGDPQNCMHNVLSKWIQGDSVQILKSDSSLLLKPTPPEELKKRPLEENKL